MKNVLIGLIGAAALSFIANGASATSKLSDLQLDAVTAGLQLDAVTAGPFGFDCPGCTLASTNSASNNGITTSSSSTTIVPLPAPPPPPTGGGSNGGGTNNGGSNGGGTNGGDNSGGGGTSGGVNTPLPSAPSVVTSITVPAGLAAIIAGASTITTQ